MTSVPGIVVGCFFGAVVLVIVITVCVCVCCGRRRTQGTATTTRLDTPGNGPLTNGQGNNNNNNNHNHNDNNSNYGLYYDGAQGNSSSNNNNYAGPMTGGGVNYPITGGAPPPLYPLYPPYQPVQEPSGLPPPANPLYYGPPYGEPSAPPCPPLPVPNPLPSYGGNPYVTQPPPPPPPNYAYGLPPAGDDATWGAFGPVPLSQAGPTVHAQGVTDEVRSTSTRTSDSLTGLKQLSKSASQ